jgi:HTH-type transcriptional regulator/antitoxin HigA
MDGQGVTMTWKPIRNQDDERRVVARMKELDSKELTPGTPEADEMDLLCILIDHYNQSMEERYPVPAKDIVEMIMHEHDLSRSDLEPYLGSKGRISDILRGKRGLSLGQMRKLHERFGIPYELMIESTPEESDESKVTTAEVFDTQKAAIKSAVIMAMLGTQRRVDKHLFKVVHAPAHGQVWVSAMKDIPKGTVFKTDADPAKRDQGPIGMWETALDRQFPMDHGDEGQTLMKRSDGMVSLYGTIGDFSKLMISEQYGEPPSWIGLGVGESSDAQHTGYGMSTVTQWMGTILGYKATAEQISLYLGENVSDMDVDRQGKIDSRDR